MAYRRPGVTVTQEFAAAAPALAAFNLPNVLVGPAYQIVDNDLLGTYEGAEQSYAYASLAAAAIVDDAMVNPEELFPVTKKNISVQLSDVVVEVVAQADTGAGNGTAFTDDTVDMFIDVVAGDILTVVGQPTVTVIAAQTNGSCTNESGLRNRLTAGVAGQFANVKVGDTVVTTSSASPYMAVTATVTIKLSDDVLILSGNINDGTGTVPTISAAVNYSITGARGVTNAGTYKVKSKTSVNALVLVSPLPDSPEKPLRYFIQRNIVGTVDVPRLAVPAASGFTADAMAVTMPDSFLVNGFPVVASNVSSSYRALRTDLSSEIFSFDKIADIEAKFGVGQIVPANILPYALSIAKANTATSVGGLALGADFATDEVLAFAKSLDVLSLEDKYALVPLTFSPSVHAAFKTHCEQKSLPDTKLERVCIFNSLLNTIGLVQDELVTSASLSGCRSIVTTQVVGSANISLPAVLNDATPDQFLNVAAGDTVTIVSGTGVTPGAYVVASKQSSNKITLVSGFVASGTPSDIVYYVQRKDGLGSDGVTFYDRNAAFITNGAAAGHYLEILAGAYAGKWLIGSLVSDKQLVLAEPILGVTSLISSVDYRIIRNLSKDEQAANIAGYSDSFGSRRAVHTWPDIVQAPVGSDIMDFPGYMAATTIAALTSGLPTQQGFTNLTISGFIGLKHSTKYFSEDQLNTIADGGTLVFIQEGPQQPLLIRHQLTTDRSSIKFQEYSVTKNVDFCAKFIRNSFKGPIGKYNIVDTTMDYLKTVAQADISFLKDKTRLQYIGGVIRSGALTGLVEDPNQIDTVNMRFKLSIPIPLNYIDIVLEV